MSVHVRIINLGLDSEVKTHRSFRGGRKRCAILGSNASASCSNRVLRCGVGSPACGLFLLRQLRGWQRFRNASLMRASNRRRDRNQRRSTWVPDWRRNHLAACRSAADHRCGRAVTIGMVSIVAYGCYGYARRGYLRTRPFSPGPHTTPTLDARLRQGPSLWKRECVYGYRSCVFATLRSRCNFIHRNRAVVRANHLIARWPPARHTRPAGARTSRPESVRHVTRRIRHVLVAGRISDVRDSQNNRTVDADVS